MNPKEKVIKGMLLAPGVAMGKAFVVHKLAPIPMAGPGEERRAEEELEKLRDNIQEVKKELAYLRDQVAADIGREKGGIIDVQLLVIEDVHFIKEIERAIEEKHVAYETAIYEVLQQYEERFLRVKDAYLREKYLDLKDVLLRMLNRSYFRQRKKELENTENRILVCEQILPTTLLGFNKKAFDGIVTVTGGLGSHAAILARSYGIPAIGVPKGIAKRIPDGSVVFVDGYDSAIYVNPDQTAQKTYLQEISDYEDYRVRIKTGVPESARMRDRTPLSIMANCGTLEDVENAVEAGADGIGLFRTEFMFYAHQDFPTEDQQVEFYKKVIERFEGKDVTFRTLDLGGDKTLPYFLLPKQVNPYLGWRSLKISFDHPNEFKTQLKALLRAAVFGNVKLLFPMVTNFSDIRQCKQYLVTCQNELRTENAEFEENIKVGAMIETPSAVSCLTHILPEVDFISIGTNDLIQHILAVDRDNPKVSQFYVAHHPAVLANLKTIFSEADKRNCPVTLCGEMGNNPIYMSALIGMGLRNFSMAPSLVPILKDVAGHLSLPECESLALDILGLKTSEEILSKMKDDIALKYSDIKRIV